MKRLFVGFAIVAALACALGSVAQAQDKVIYRDEKKKDKVTEQPGQIKSESPKEVVVKPNIGAEKTIPVSAVIDVVYLDQVKAGDKAKYRDAEKTEHVTAEAAKGGAKDKELSKALGMYKDILASVKSGTATPVQRHMEFKVAFLTARLAGDNKGEQKQATDLLAAFKKSHPTGWQIVTVTKLLADLYVKVGEYEKAAGAYDDLKKLPGLSEETKAECDLEAARNLNLAGKTAEAAGRLKTIVATMQKTNPQYEQLNMMLIVCNAKLPGKLKDSVAELEKMINTSKDKDPARTALALNTLGECYLANNQAGDAFWQFMYVDQVYHQDKNELKKAVANLIKLFKERKQPEKAKEYADKLERLNRA